MILEPKPKEILRAGKQEVGFRACYMLALRVAQMERLDEFSGFWLPGLDL